MKHHDWYNCYTNGWTADDIIPAAFSHPAKFSKQLIRRIYSHLLAEGYIRPGDKIADPFGGVALGGFWAMRYGLDWYGVELEERFVGLGNGNIDLWNGRYAEHIPGWGTARLLQGDSRRLVDLLGGVGCVVSSPPYAESINANDAANDAMARRDRKKANGIPDTAYHNGGPNSQQNRPQVYGRSPGQLGSMPEGDYTAVISSPPYADAVANNGEGPGARFDPIYHNGENATKKSSANGYGVTEGNLGNLAAVVSSPPFEASLGNAANTKEMITIRPYLPDPKIVGNYIQRFREESGLTRGDVELAILGKKTALCYRWEEGASLPNPQHWKQLKKLLGFDGALDAAMLHEEVVAAKAPNTINNTGHKDIDIYGVTPGNIGNDQGQTFWQAAHTIISQCYEILRPGGVAAFVTGDYVRKGQRVEFGRQWLELCEAVGFTAVEHITAWKREPGPVQAGIFEDKDLTVDRISFFRRLANQKNPESEIVNEDVWIVVKG